MQQLIAEEQVRALAEHARAEAAEARAERAEARTDHWRRIGLAATIASPVATIAATVTLRLIG